nr:MAG TPA: hypothetical protein [Caudoviricetes sp.]
MNRIRELRCKSAVNLPTSGGTYEWLSWSNLNDYSACGLACANLNNGLGNANWNILAGAIW